MSNPARSLLGIAGAVVLVAVAAIAIGRARFERRVSGEIAALLGAAPGEARVVTEDDLTGLPDPVRRWLRWAGVVGKPYPSTVRLKQEGRFRQAEGRPWMPFTAEEYFTTEPPGFIWKTTVRMFPLVSIVGRDCYVAGRGSIEMRLLGSVPVADASGPRMDQGALLRYLNETMWFPAAALSPYVTWQGIDANTTQATMSYQGATASATFVFDAEGRPTDMTAERQDLARGRLETWSTPLRDYGAFAGVRIPSEGVGIWKYESGDFPYIELRITALEVNRPSEYS
jgi:hypothetical protein